MPSNVKSKVESKHKPRRKKKKIKSSTERSLDGSEGDLELDRELYPIVHYMSDRSEMVKQMFGILKKDKIQSMLPPILKEIPWQDLKSHCLEQLNSMSEKQIIRILEGKPYAPDLEDEKCGNTQNVDVVSSSSSSSSTSSSCDESSSCNSQSGSDSEQDLGTKLETGLKKGIVNLVGIKADPDKLEDDPDMLQIGLSAKEMGDLLGEDEDLDKKEKDTKISLEENGKRDNSESGTGVKGVKSLSAPSGKKDEAKEGKTLLEILELEMRARAIRALLKQSSSSELSGGPKSGSLSSNTKSVTASMMNSEVSESVKSHVKSQSTVPVVVKGEVLSDEDDVVFVNESHSNIAPPDKSRKRAQKECISAVYDVSTDILKFKPTVMCTTSKVNLVDTSGNPIILPTVKSHTRVQNVKAAVIVIDNDICDSVSAPNTFDKESSSLKRRANTSVERENSAFCNNVTDSDIPKSGSKTKLESNIRSKISSPAKDDNCMTLSNDIETEKRSSLGANADDAGQGINQQNGKKIILDAGSCNKEKYPMCLYFLDLLQYEHFRREVVSSQCTKFIDDQQILLWQHYTRRRTRLLQKQAEESAPGAQSNSHPPGTANGTGNGFNCNSQTNGQVQAVQKVP